MAVFVRHTVLVSHIWIVVYIPVLTMLIFKAFVFHLMTQYSFLTPGWSLQSVCMVLPDAPVDPQATNKQGPINTCLSSCSLTQGRYRHLLQVCALHTDCVAVKALLYHLPYSIIAAGMWRLAASASQKSMKLSTAQLRHWSSRPRHMG